MRNAKIGAAVVAAALAWTAGAEAQECAAGAAGCASTPLQATARSCTDLAGFTYDSGWLPADQPIQVHFRVHLGGMINPDGSAAGVDMRSTARASWPDAVTVTVEGARDGGTLNVAYAAEIVAEIRYDFSWSGVHLRGTFNIPIPGVAAVTDRLRMRGSQRFTPLAMDAMTPVVARAETARFNVFTYDAIAAFFGERRIPLPFGSLEIPVSGGFRLDLQGNAEAIYRTTSLGFTEASGAMTTPTGSVAIAAPREGFGAGATLHATGMGSFDCRVALTLLPTIFINIAGRAFNFDFPVDINFDSAAQMAPLVSEPITLPFPDIAVSPGALDLGRGVPGELREDAIRIENNGSVPLHVELSSPEPGVMLAQRAVDILPREYRDVAVALRLGGDSTRAVVVLATNDPDQPSVAIPLTADAVGYAMDPDAPWMEGDPDGPGRPRNPGDPVLGPGGGLNGGCSVSGPGSNTGGSLALVALPGLAALLFMRRRRSRSAR